MDFNLSRVRHLNTRAPVTGPIVYWMSRDQRVHDNWALLYAAKLANERNQPLAVVFCLTDTFLGATLRHYDFMLPGLQELEKELKKLRISFFLLQDEPQKLLPEFVKKYQVGEIVTDFSPMKIGRKWRQAVADEVKIAVTEVDAHNIVPAWIVSTKQEVGARTFRPKIQKLLPEFLTEFPALKKQTLAWPNLPTGTQWGKLREILTIDRSIPAVTWLKPGEKAAGIAARKFLKTHLHEYFKDHNDPSVQGQSNLSPYLHFGQLSAQRLALEVEKSKAPKNSKTTFLEQLIVRRELSDNFCLYNADYDSVAGFSRWAQQSLELHEDDPREFKYALATLEAGKTHDVLWNAAQTEMVKRGKMHGYLRMYWAKKILEWSPDAATAMKHCIYLNDTYELDGRDPNGYVGIAWSIGGIHDRPWFNRPIFGLIRYMSYNSTKTKFNVAKYLQFVNSL